MTRTVLFFFVMNFVCVSSVVMRSSQLTSWNCQSKHRLDNIAVLIVNCKNYCSPLFSISFSVSANHAQCVCMREPLTNVPTFHLARALSYYRLRLLFGVFFFFFCIQSFFFFRPEAFKYLLIERSWSKEQEQKSFFTFPRLDSFRSSAFVAQFECKFRTKVWFVFVWNNLVCKCLRKISGIFVRHEPLV